MVLSTSISTSIHHINITIKIHPSVRRSKRTQHPEPQPTNPCPRHILPPPQQLSIQRECWPSLKKERKKENQATHFLREFPSFAMISTSHLGNHSRRRQHRSLDHRKVLQSSETKPTTNNEPGVQVRPQEEKRLDFLQNIRGVWIFTYLRPRSLHTRDGRAGRAIAAGFGCLGVL